MLNKEEMMEGEQLHQLFDQGLGKYLYINVVSKRCKQLATGEMRLSEPDSACYSLGDIVAKEIHADKLAIRPLAGNKLVNVLESQN